MSPETVKALVCWSLTNFQSRLRKVKFDLWDFICTRAMWLQQIAQNEAAYVLWLSFLSLLPDRFRSNNLKLLPESRMSPEQAAQEVFWQVQSQILKGLQYMCDSCKLPRNVVPRLYCGAPAPQLFSSCCAMAETSILSYLVACSLHNKPIET
jgi:hypothetical protein